ncbi:MAG: aminotransferase class I/II-fold pyridoxal phosphate-dependent enzyme [Rubripirellula sp.]
MRAFDDFDGEINRLKTLGRLRSLTPRRAEGIYLYTDHGERLCNFSSNDYLGFASRHCDPDRQGAGASALVSGWTELHQSLADDLAGFEQMEASCLFPSGYAACSGTVATLAREGDIIFSDALNHASLIDGCRLSRATCVVYPHRDMPALRALLGEQRRRYRNAWLVTDGVFSMDGHVAPLVQICDLAEEFDASVIVDEAHATGVLGDRGAGVAELLGVKHRVDVIIGTLSKALGAHGGFVASNSQVVRYLINRCRSLIYSTALPPVVVDAARVSLNRIATTAADRQRVKSLARSVRAKLEQVVSIHEMDVPIIPVIVGADNQATCLAEKLRKHGFFVPAIRPPTVPEGTARLRISLSALHTDQMIEDLIRCVQKVL